MAEKSIPRRILISGGGVAGPALAYWLSRSPHLSDLDITIVERSPSPRTTGQAVDIRGPGVKVMQLMGLEPEVRRMTTNEKGIEKIGSTGKIVGVIDVTGNVKQQAFTSEFEVLRADLARILIDASVHYPNVKIIYGEHVSALSQSLDGSSLVHVDFANGKLPSSEYDLVVAADGVLSRTRALATGRSAKEDTHDIGGFYVAYFTAKRVPSDSPTHARFYHAVGSRVILIRPSPAGTGVLLMFRRQGDLDVAAATTRGVEAQKQLVADIFADAGWETDRVLEALKISDDFYFEHLAQVRCPQWSVGRIAFLGDAAHAPTAFTGMGTSLALYGAYILAGEISHAARDGRSVPEALKSYDRMARPFVERVQNSPFRAAKLMFPETWWGVWILNAIVAICCWLGLPGLLNSAVEAGGDKEKETLPMYEWIMRDSK